MEISDEEKVKNEAREIAFDKVPTENGFFDARSRLAEFNIACLQRGYIAIPGVSFLLTDEQVDKAIELFRLDMR